MTDNRIIVQFKRACDSYMIGEQAAFSPEVVETYVRRNFADVVGPVDPVAAAVSEAVDAALSYPVVEPLKSNKRKG